jgi:dTDP-4-dehydrorhamnose reductase
MRILVTGASGQVGGVLAKRLAAFGEIIAPGRSAFDLSKIDAVSARLDAISPDVIVNAAAYTAVDRAEDEPELAHRINAEAPGAIGGWAGGRKVPVVHFSTDYVFDGSGHAPWREDDVPAPLSVYGKSKLSGEQALRGAAGPHLIVRSSWIYHHAGKNFLRTIARLATEREELRIVADQIGAPISADAIGDALAALLQKYDGSFSALAARSGATLHLTASGVASWHDFAVAIVAGLKARGAPVQAKHIVPIKTSEFPTKARRPLNSRLDLTRVAKLLGYTMPSWQSVLDVALDNWPDLNVNAVVNRPLI